MACFTACEDGCTGILLQDLQTMGRDLYLQAGRVTDRSEVPWWRLQDLVAGPITTTERMLDQWEGAARGVYNLLGEDSHFQLKHQATQMYDQVNYILNTFNQIA